MKEKDNYNEVFRIIAFAIVLMFALSGCGDTDTDNGPVKYTVTFNANGGTVSPSSVQVESGKTVSSLPTPTKTTGDTYFLGWYTKNGTTSGDWDSSFTTATPVTASITVYAQWVELVARVETRQLTEANWRAILTEINTAGKYVNLNLSTCTQSDASIGGGLRSNGIFDPIYDFSTGKNYIISLILPDAATRISGVSFLNSTPSQGFTSLNSVSASAVTDIGDHAFYGCTSLVNVTLPQATTIQIGAFQDCTGLTSVDFPTVIYILGGAFRGCTSLTSVNCPMATAIDGFMFCTSLISINCPQADYIGQSAFASTGTIALTVTLGPIAPSRLDGGIFGWDGNDRPKAVTVKVPAGATGYGEIPKTYSGTDATVNWGNGFRGGGWDGSKFWETWSPDSNITLSVEYHQ